jgi:hypothetical protein
MLAKVSSLYYVAVVDDGKKSLIVAHKIRNTCLLSATHKDKNHIVYITII